MRKDTLRNVCGFVGALALLVYMILVLMGETMIEWRLISASVGAVAYACELLVEIICHYKFGSTIGLLAICILDIILTILFLMAPK